MDVFPCWILGVVTFLFLLTHLNHVSPVQLHLVRRTYFWHFTNPRHAVKTRYIIPILPGISRVPYGDTVLHINYIVRLSSIPETVKRKHRRFSVSRKGVTTLNNLCICHLTILSWSEIIRSIFTNKETPACLCHRLVGSSWVSIMLCSSVDLDSERDVMVRVTWTGDSLPHATLALLHVLLGHPSLCSEACLLRIQGSQALDSQLPLVSWVGPSFPSSFSFFKCWIKINNIDMTPKSIIISIKRDNENQL